MLHNYAAPYLCVHRADLHAVLLGGGAWERRRHAHHRRARDGGDRARRHRLCGEYRRTCLGRRCADRRRRPLEHGAPLPDRGRDAASRHRSHGLARDGRAVGVARCAPQHAGRRLAWAAAACGGLSGAPRRRAQRRRARRGGTRRRCARLGSSHQPRRRCNAPPAAPAASFRPCSRRCPHGEHGRSTTGRRSPVLVRWLAIVSP